MTNKITRRGILGALTAGTAAACGTKTSQSFTSDGSIVAGKFSHGVASGDPQTNAVIIWTRVSPEGAHDSQMSVVWEISESVGFETLTAFGTVQTDKTRDWTVKVDVMGLSAGQDYYYRFIIGEEISPIGQTKTLPKGDIDEARFAVVSCANWQHGFFNTYDHIARQDHFDALIHLGDYFYEYGIEAADEQAAKLGRLHEPLHEVLSLQDYRQRHAQYRTDSSLQAVSAKLPLIAIWDDHETSNDSWHGGAENHNDGEGDWETRRQAALRAYYEWMPIREPRAGRMHSDIFRSYDYGNLLTLLSVETRLTARAEPLVIEDYADDIRAYGNADKFKTELLYNPSREMFGPVQSQFILDRLKESKAKGTPWRVIANQVIMGRLITTDLELYVSEEAVANIEPHWPEVRDFVGLSKYQLPVYPDSWDGYPVARETFYQQLIEANVQDILVLTGDAHEFWVNDLTTEAGDKVGVELVTSSVSSKTLTSYLGGSTEDYTLLLTKTNEDARYYNAMNNGYIDLRITPNKANVTMVGINTVLSRDYEASIVASFTLRKSGETLKVRSPKGLNFKQRLLFSGLA